MLLLYCNNGIVAGWHDVTQNVDPSSYGSGTRVIPYDQPLDSLPKVGTPPTAPGQDTRPYGQPAETVALLIAYAAQVRWERVTAGITFSGTTSVPANTDRVSQTLVASLAQYAATLAPTAAIDFTQDGVHYAITAQDVINMNNQILAHAQQCRTIEAQCLADLNSPTPTIQTYADVEARFAGVRTK
jgi:hypothetical protein